MRAVDAAISCRGAILIVDLLVIYLIFPIKKSAIGQWRVASKAITNFGQAANNTTSIEPVRTTQRRKENGWLAREIINVDEPTRKKLFVWRASQSQIIKPALSGSWGGDRESAKISNNVYKEAI